MAFDLQVLLAKISQIHTNNGLGNAQVVAEINAAVTEAVTPLQQQITDLQTGLSADVDAELGGNDTVTASTAPETANGASADDTVTGAAV